MSMIDSPAIWVGSYGKYNAGNLAGKWFKLEDYADRSEFYAAALAFHADEDDPELMFNDWENIPSGMVSEFGVEEDVWKFIEVCERFDDEAIVRAGLELGIDLDKIEDAYYGEFENDIDLAYDVVENGGYLADVPESVARYFNYEAFARDLMIDDFMSEKGFYFYRNW